CVWQRDHRQFQSFPTRRSSDLSGELAGLQVSEETYRRVRRFVEECRATAGGEELYCYNPFVNSSREGMKHYNKPSTVMTSVGMLDRKSTRLNSSHVKISYAVFC